MHIIVKDYIYMLYYIPWNVSIKSSKLFSFKKSMISPGDDLFVISIIMNYERFNKAINWSLKAFEDFFIRWAPNKKERFVCPALVFTVIVMWPMNRPIAIDYYYHHACSARDLHRHGSCFNLHSQWWWFASILRWNLSDFDYKSSNNCLSGYYDVQTLLSNMQNVFLNVYCGHDSPSCSSTSTWPRSEHYLWIS